MATANQSQAGWKPLPLAEFYANHPKGSTKTTSFRNDLAMKGLMVDDKQLLLIKEDIIQRFVKKANSGEWPKAFNEPLNVDTKQLQQVIDAVKAKFSPRLRWSRISQFDENWVDFTLRRLATKAKQVHKRRNGTPLKNIQQHKKPGPSNTSTLKSPSRNVAISRKPLLASNSDPKDIAPKLRQTSTSSQGPTPRPNPVPKLSQGPPSQPNNDLARRIQVAKAVDKMRRKDNIGPITSLELVFSWKTACIGLCDCITSKERRRSGELEKTKIQGAALSHMTTQQAPYHFHIYTHAL
jgi:hypothetical protein